MTMLLATVVPVTDVIVCRFTAYGALRKSCSVPTGNRRAVSALTLTSIVTPVTVHTV